MKVLSSWKVLVALTASVLLGFGNVAFAAETGGTIKGTVVSDAGQPVAGATVTVTHDEKGITRSTQANNDGEYVLRSLPVGRYTAIISSEGYTSAKQEGLEVTVGQPLVLQSTLQSGGSMEEVVVIGTAIQALDMAESTGGMTFDDAKLQVMPVDNGFEEMALMVPGVSENSEFSSSSIGGASSAENSFYLNGINVTVIETGIGALRMPWEAIQQTNVQTSGVTAEFGGALGGVVNAVSKSGSNDWDFGIEYRLDPESTYDQFDSVRNNSDVVTYRVNNELDEDEFTEFNAWVSGPIIEDKVFFYALVNPTESTFSGATGGRIEQGVLPGNFASTVEESDRWFVNLEYFINDKHSIGYTGFDTERTQETVNTPYFGFDNSLGSTSSTSLFEDGGQFTGFTYHGDFTDTFSVDLVFGSTEEEVVDLSESNLPLVENCFTSTTCSDASQHTNASINPQEFTRDQERLDFHWDVSSDHRLNFGIDRYETRVVVDTRQNGEIIGDPGNVDPSAAFGWWSYGISTDPADDNTYDDGNEAFVFGVPVGERYIRRRVRIRGTDSHVRSEAFYIQDNWQLSNEVTLNLGVRVTDFENTVRGGAVYADMSDNVAPRLAAVWDIGGEGKRRATVSWGRYFQPISTRMNITQGSTSIEYFDYYRWDQTDTGTGLPILLSDGSPSRGAAFDINGSDPGTRDYRQTGIVDPALIASKNLEAMYSDQITLSYDAEVFDTMRAGVRFTYNELKRSVEDTDYMPVLSQELASRGIVDNTGQNSFYIVANPGSDVQISYDFDGDLDGNADRDDITLSAADLQLPKPVRKYIAWDFTLAGAYGDKINFDASYTWSHSYGNTEGLVRTDNGQADPGWTVSYDYADLMDGSYGNTPNDHRHAIKLAGTYDINENWVAGLVFRATSGSPKSIFGTHPLDAGTCIQGTNLWSYNDNGTPNDPLDDFGCASAGYGANSHFDENGNLAPRGTNGNLPWVKVLNASITYQNEDVLGGRFSLRTTLYNILGEDNPINIRESSGPDYGLTEIYQGQRYLSLVARLEF